jgi:hypothetical protein
LKRKFDQTKPQPNESINIFFDTLLGYYDRLQGTPEEISEETMKAHIYTQSATGIYTNYSGTPTSGWGDYGIGNGFTQRGRRDAGVI